MKIQVIEASNFDDAISKLKEIFESIEEKENSDNPTIEEIVKRLSIRRKVSCNTMSEFLKEVRNLNIRAYINIMLKEIANFYDEKYSGSIRELSYVYAISSLNGTILQLPSSKIVSTNVFNAFRLYKEAAYAKKVLKQDFDILFPQGEKAQSKD